MIISEAEKYGMIFFPKSSHWLAATHSPELQIRTLFCISNATTRQINIIVILIHHCPHWLKYFFSSSSKLKEELGGLMQASHLHFAHFKCSNKAARFHHHHHHHHHPIVIIISSFITILSSPSLSALSSLLFFKWQMTEAPKQCGSIFTSPNATVLMVNACAGFKAVQCKMRIFSFLKCAASWHPPKSKTEPCIIWKGAPNSNSGMHRPTSWWSSPLQNPHR